MRSDASDDDLPEQIIVFDREFDRAPFYLRVRIENGVDHVELHGAGGPVKSLPAAIAVSVGKGYAPTHCLERPGGLSTIAPAIVERLARQLAEKTT